MQMTQVSFTGRPPPLAARAAAVASRARVARRASAATAARHADLWRGQSARWQSRPQYQARWHWPQERHLALALPQRKQTRRREPPFLATALALEGLVRAWSEPASGFW